MILVDTSVWIDHLHASEPALVAALEAGEVASHPLVIEELALGSLANRSAVLGLLGDLRPLPVLGHDEVMALVELNQLWSRGLSAIDAHLLGSVRLEPGSQLWTRDKRLRDVASELSLAVIDA